MQAEARTVLPVGRRTTPMNRNRGSAMPATKRWTATSRSNACRTKRRGCGFAPTAPHFIGGGEVRLSCELVPRSTWGENVRSLLTRSQWDRLRRFVYAQAGGACEICGDVGTNQGRKHDLEAHEVWAHDDDTHTQTLMRMIALCPECHRVKHIGRAFATGAHHRALAHLARVNAWGDAEVYAHVDAHFTLHTLRSAHAWEVRYDGLAAYAGSGLPLTPEEIPFPPNADDVFISSDGVGSDKEA